MIPSDHFVRFYNEVFKFLTSNGSEHLLQYYKHVSKNQEQFCLDLFKAKQMRGMYEYWERIRIEENCEMTHSASDDTYSFHFHLCPSMSKILDNDSPPSPEYCEHCSGWIFPIMTQCGVYAVYNMIDRKRPCCEMFVFKDMGKAVEKRDELIAKYGLDVIVTNF